VNLFRYDCRKRIKRLLHILLPAAVVIAMFFTWRIGFTADSELELSVKTAYIYNFIKFIGWQKEKGEAFSGPIRICMVGDDPLGEALSELENRQVKGHSIQVERHIYETGDLSGYHIVVIGRSEAERLPGILKQLGDANVLTVSDIQQFAQKGGGIGLVTVEGKVKIEINSRVTSQAGLRVSAKLLEVARIVQ
jgi:hypothetical protein